MRAPTLLRQGGLLQPRRRVGSCCDCIASNEECLFSSSNVDPHPDMQNAGTTVTVLFSPLAPNSCMA